MKWYYVRQAGLTELTNEPYINWIEPPVVIDKAFKAGQAKPRVIDNVIHAPRSAGIGDERWYDGRRRGMGMGRSTRLGKPRKLSMRLFKLTDDIVIAVGSWFVDFTGRQGGSVWYYVLIDGKWVNKRANNVAVREALGSLKVMHALASVRL